MKTKNILHSSESDDWFTPKKYIDSVRKVIGQIDLDPSSCEEANKTVMAINFFTIEDDGLYKRWYGSVFMNPPYGFSKDSRGKEFSNQELWTAKLINEYEQKNVKEAICLVNSATDTKWFSKLWRYPICFLDHRIKFIPGQNNNKKHGPTHGNVFVYFGKNMEEFRKEFSQYGIIVKPSVYYSENLNI